MLFGTNPLLDSHFKFLNLNLNSPLLVVDPGLSGQRGMNSNYSKYPVACRRSRFIGAAGIEILAFRKRATTTLLIKSCSDFIGDSHLPDRFPDTSWKSSAFPFYLEPRQSSHQNPTLQNRERNCNYSVPNAGAWMQFGSG